MRKTILQICIILTALLLSLTAPLSAASRLNFPRLSFEASSFTGIAIVNPSSSTARVTLTAYGSDGQALRGTGFTNPVTVDIGPGQQFANVTSAIFGSLSAGTTGWVRAESGADDLTGFFLFLNIPTTFFDGADLPRAGRTIVFSGLAVGGSSSTELNILNPGDSSALVTLTLMGAPNSPSRQLMLPARGINRLDVAQFFGINQLPVGVYAVASADRDVAGFQLVGSQGSDLLGLNANPVGETLNTLFFPQLAVLNPFETELTVINYSNNVDAILTITAFRPDGTPYGAPQLSMNPVTRLLRRGQALREDLEAMFGFTGNTPLEGWLQVESTAQAVNGTITYALPAVGSVAAVPAVSQASTRAVFSHIATASGFFTGVAALNAGTLAAQLRIVALRPDGSVLGAASTSLNPGQRISQLITQLIPESSGQAGGLIFVRSSAPVYLTSLFGTDTGRVLANIPPQPAPASYRPDAGLATVRINPPLAALNLSAKQNFQLQGAGAETRWRVNGIMGGNAEVGTIEVGPNGATYTAPAALPSKLPITITAESGSETAAASLDMVATQTLFDGLGELLSVAYLGGLQRLYTAERAASGGAAPQGAPASLIFEFGQDNQGNPRRERILERPGEEISKLLAFTGVDRRDYLLATARNGGQILRISPSQKQAQTVIQGLNGPTTMVFDPANGDLVVADQAGIQRFPRSMLNSGLTPAGGASGPVLLDDGGARGEFLFQTGNQAAAGVVVDRCTGFIYTSEVNTDPAIEARGVIRQTDPTTGESSVIDVLTEPGPLLAIYRSGQPCPESFHFLGLDPGTDAVLLYIPFLGEILVWSEAIPASDVAFVPGGGMISANDSVVLSLPDSEPAPTAGDDPGQAGPDGSIVQIPLPEVYDDDADNPPPTELEDFEIFLVEFADPALEALVRETLEVNEEFVLTDFDTAFIFVLDGPERGVSDLSGIEFLYFLFVLDLSHPNSDGPIFDIEPLRFNSFLLALLLKGHLISDISPLAELFDLILLDLSDNIVADLEPLRDLLLLEFVDLSNNFVEDIEPLRELIFLSLLGLSDNFIADIDPLRDLIFLETVNLSNNLIEDITPLVENPFFEGEEAFVNLTNNPLGADDCVNIATLVERGVTVVIDEQLETLCFGQ